MAVRAHALFDRVAVKQSDPGKPLRAFADYLASIDDTKLPASITLEVKL